MVNDFSYLRYYKINSIKFIEGFMYRRNYSPYVSKASSYLEALERDEIVNNLRREYSHYKALESEYDDLRYQIGRAER